jgi:2-polyprenyl-6-methoxyphenol hydroxylase-like FAD-dependent oxidoreductase
VQYAYYEGIDTDGYEWLYRDGVGAGLIPTNDGLTLVFVATSPERMRTMRVGRTAEDAFATVFGLAAPRHADRLAGASRTSRLHGWAGRRGFVRRSWGPGWALVGDAGYFKDPISTHGITDALRDAELLARGRGRHRPGAGGVSGDPRLVVTAVVRPQRRDRVVHLGSGAPAGAAHVVERRDGTRGIPCHWR